MEKQLSNHAQLALISEQISNIRTNTYKVMVQLEFVEQTPEIQEYTQKLATIYNDLLPIYVKMSDIAQK